MNWDLSALYKHESDLEADLNEARNRAIGFENVCKGKLKELSGHEFLESIREYEAINEILGRIMTYAFLNFATDSDKGGFFAGITKDKIIKEFEEIYFCKEFFHAVIIALIN